MAATEVDESRIEDFPTHKTVREEYPAPQVEVSSLADRSQLPICIIYTGGTFGQRKEASDSLLTVSAGEAVRHELSKYPQFASGFKSEQNYDPSHPLVWLSTLHPIDSTEATPQVWNLLGILIDQRQRFYRGFVIVHGTDTMAYTASALAFMLYGQRFPVVITGSQRPLFEMTSDALGNLTAAIALLSSPHLLPLLQDTFICFNYQLLLGTRAAKIHSMNFNAFGAPNFGVIGYCDGDGWLVDRQVLSELSRHREQERHASLVQQRFVECNGGHFKGWNRHKHTFRPDGICYRGCPCEIKGHERDRDTNRGGDLERDSGGAAEVDVRAAEVDVGDCHGDGQRERRTGSATEKDTGKLLWRPDIFYDIKHQSFLRRFHARVTVGIVRIFPGVLSALGIPPLSKEIIDYEQLKQRTIDYNLLKNKVALVWGHLDGLIVESFGTGNAPLHLRFCLRLLREEFNKPVLYVTECFQGGSATKYSVSISDLEGTPLFDMVVPAAYTRLLLEISVWKFIGVTPLGSNIERTMSKEVRNCFTSPEARHQMVKLYRA